MVPTVTYASVLEVLGEAFRTRYKRHDVNITGILFARPSSEFAQREVLPHIDYWHHRSSNSTDFFCPGYVVDSSGQSGSVVASVGGELWCFNNMHFAMFLEKFEGITRWRYSGGCEVVITNVRYDKAKRQASLDLSTAIAIDLETAHRDNAMRDVTGLCEAVFTFARNLNESDTDPCWIFSDQLGKRVVTGSLKELLLSYLPSSIKPEARKAFHFAASDLGA
jgi:hypothetical protein